MGETIVDCRKLIYMKTKIRYRYIATRGGYVSLANQITDRSEVHLQIDIVQELAAGETGKPVMAVAKKSTTFTGWSDGVKSNPRTDTFSKNDHPTKEMYANFREKYWYERFMDWLWSRRGRKPERRQ